MSALQGSGWRRLLWAPFLHLGDMHIYYNMSSLMLKASELLKTLILCIENQYKVNPSGRYPPLTPLFTENMPHLPSSLLSL